MSNVAKQIIIILVILLLACAGLVFMTYTEKSVLEKDRTSLEQQLASVQDSEKKIAAEKQSLNEQIQDAQNTRSRLQKQLSDLNNQIATITGERDNWRSQVETLRRERDELMVKLQEKPKEIVVEKEVIKEVPAANPASAIAADPSGGDDQYWGAVLREKAALELQLNDLSAQLSSANVEIEELKKANSDLNLELGLLKTDKEEILRKIKYAEDLANSLSVQLAREKNDKRFLVERQEKSRDETSALRSQVKELNSAKVSLEKSIERLKEDKQRVEQKLAETESVIQNRINEVLEIKSSLDQRLKQEPGNFSNPQEVELPPIIVSPSASPYQDLQSPRVADIELPVGRQGRIVSLNEENNFVIIDLGENAGVRIGDRFNVYRGEKYIAAIEIIQVRKDISAADIKQKGAKLKTGDIVR